MRAFFKGLGKLLEAIAYAWTQHQKRKKLQASQADRNALHSDPVGWFSRLHNRSTRKADSTRP